MSGPSCNDAVCVTCSDQLSEVLITAVSPDGSTAQGTCAGSACEVSVELLDDVRVGDRVLAHGGVALQRGALETPR